MRTVRRTPRRTPGKNPVMMARTGNLSQCTIGFCCDAVLFGLMAIPVGALDGFAVLAEAGAEGVATLFAMTH